MKSFFLRMGAMMNFTFAIGHFVCLFFLYDVFRLYGIEEGMFRLAILWHPIPYMVTIIIMGCFVVAGLYALSANGDIRKLPFLKLGIWVISWVYLGRGIAGSVLLLNHFTMLELSSTLIAFWVGTCYAIGGKGNK